MRTSISRIQVQADALTVSHKTLGLSLILSSHLETNSTGLSVLSKYIAANAFFDAAERGEAPKCHPRTRLVILAEINELVRNPEIHKKLIIWMYGPAGAGKSAIAQTIAEIFAKEGLLAASFFFSRSGNGTDSTSKFIASIAYQLSLSIPELREDISAAVEHDQHVFSRNMASQIQALIVKPLNDLASQGNPIKSRLVVVDGLDEAHDEMTHRELLDALAISTSQLRIPLIFLVASRPETIIRQSFIRPPLRSLFKGLALDKHYKPDEDIRIFLRAKFDEIQESHPSGNVLPDVWPAQQDMDYLIHKSSGQFIFASTVIKYIDSPRHNPTKRLKVITGLSDPGRDTPFAQLDSLYHFILSSVEDIAKVLEILALVILQTGYGDYLSPKFIETLLCFDPGDVTAILTDMHALIHIPSSESKDDTIRTHHESLHDFLMDKNRSGLYYLNTAERHTAFARCLLRYIATAHKIEYKKARFLAILNGFISHYILAPTDNNLIDELKNFSMTNFLTKMPPKVFLATDWDSFFDCLQRQCASANIDLYQRLRNELDMWICATYENYPEKIQHCMSAACAVLTAAIDNRDIEVIFSVVTSTLSPSEAIPLRKLDAQLFLFQRLSTLSCATFNGITLLANFFNDPLRSGKYYPDESTFASLAKTLLNADAGVTLNQMNTFFPDILQASSVDPHLANILKMKIHSHTYTGEHRSTYQDYVKRCEIVSLNDQ